jgi:hypothetical protein
MTVWRGIILLMGMAASQATWAFCTGVGSFTINPGTVVVQRDATVGQPISDWLVSNQGVAYQDCNYDGTPQYAITTGIKNTGSKASVTWNGEAVYNTSVRGVGFVYEGRLSVDSTPLPGNWTGIASGQSQAALCTTSASRSIAPTGAVAGERGTGRSATGGRYRYHAAPERLLDGLSARDCRNWRGGGV